MTREEAINEIKSWAIPSEKGREVLETLIPELGESGDENLKNKSGYYKAGKFWKASTLWNATKNKIPQRVSNRYILQECTWNIGTLQRFADEVKNVQEVSLDYPIILDMNGNIIDGAHRVVKAYLEGKDIDIVYIGDDEWPEPDYDEEKAVKESEDERIRKWLYELVDEGAYLCERPFATESILAWLEKQKESLHIPETCKENAEKQTNEEKEYIRTIKSIISDFIRDKKPENLAYYQRIYDWLDGRHVPFSCGRENGAEWSEEDEKMRDRLITRLNWITYNTRTDGTSLNITFFDEIAWLKSLRPSWKPSEEQMKALLNAEGFLRAGLQHDSAKIIAELYEQLKKL